MSMSTGRTWCFADQSKLSDNGLLSATLIKRNGLRTVRVWKLAGGDDGGAVAEEALVDRYAGAGVVHLASFGLAA